MSLYLLTEHAMQMLLMTSYPNAQLKQCPVDVLQVAQSALQATQFFPSKLKVVEEQA